MKANKSENDKVLGRCKEFFKLSFFFNQKRKKVQKKNFSFLFH
jgi:hypothetical protein